MKSEEHIRNIIIEDFYYTYVDYVINDIFNDPKNKITRKLNLHIKFFEYYKDNELFFNIVNSLKNINTINGSYQNVNTSDILSLIKKNLQCFNNIELFNSSNLNIICKFCEIFDVYSLKKLRENFVDKITHP